MFIDSFQRALRCGAVVVLGAASLGASASSASFNVTSLSISASAGDVTFVSLSGMQIVGASALDGNLSGESKQLMSSQFSNQEVSVHSVFASATASVTASGLMSGSSSASPSDIPSVNHNAGTTGVTHAVEFRLSTAGTATITLDYEINEEAAANGSLVTSFSRGAVELSGSASGQSFFQRAGFDSTDDPSGRGAHFGTLSIALPLSGPQDTVNFLVRGTTWAYEPNPAVPEVATPLMFASGLLTLLCCCRGGHSGRRIKDRRTPA